MKEVLLPLFDSLNGRSDAKLPQTLPPRKRRRKPKKRTVPAKRFVKTVKVFMTDDEIIPLLEKCHAYGGISNYIRHHLGLPLNQPGRKRKNTGAAIELNF